MSDRRPYRAEINVNVARDHVVYSSWLAPRDRAGRISVLPETRLRIASGRRTRYTAANKISRRLPRAILPSLDIAGIPRSPSGCVLFVVGRSRRSVPRSAQKRHSRWDRVLSRRLNAPGRRRRCLILVQNAGRRGNAWRESSFVSRWITFHIFAFRDRLHRACRIQFLGFILQRHRGSGRQMSSAFNYPPRIWTRDLSVAIINDANRIRCHVRSRFSSAADPSVASFYSHHARRFMAPLALSLSPKVLGRSPRETLLTYCLTRQVLSRPPAEGISCKSFRIPRADFSRIARRCIAARDAFLPR